MNIPPEVIGFVVAIVLIVGTVVMVFREDDTDDRDAVTSHPVHTLPPSVDVETYDNFIEDVDVQENYCIIADTSYLEQGVNISAASLPDSFTIRLDHQYLDVTYECFYITADIDEPLHLDKGEFERLVGELR